MSARKRREQAAQETLKKVREHHERRGKSPEEAEARAQATLERQQKEAKRATQQGEESVERAGGSPQEQGEARSAGGEFLGRVGKAGADLTRRVAGKAGQAGAKALDAARGAAKTVQNVWEKDVRPDLTVENVGQTVSEFGKAVVQGYREQLHPHVVAGARRVGGAVARGAEAVAVAGGWAWDAVKKKSAEIYGNSRLRLRIDNFRAAWNERRAEKCQEKTVEAEQRLVAANQVVEGAEKVVLALQAQVERSERSGDARAIERAKGELAQASRARDAAKQQWESCAATVERHRRAEETFTQRRREIAQRALEAMRTRIIPEDRRVGRRERLTERWHDLDRECRTQEDVISALEEQVSGYRAMAEASGLLGKWKNNRKAKKVEAALARASEGLERARTEANSIRGQIEGINNELNEAYQELSRELYRHAGGEADRPDARAANDNDPEEKSTDRGETREINWSGRCSELQDAAQRFFDEADTSAKNLEIRNERGYQTAAEHLQASLDALGRNANETTYRAARKAIQEYTKAYDHQISDGLRSSAVLDKIPATGRLRRLCLQHDQEQNEPVAA